MTLTDRAPPRPAGQRACRHRPVLAAQPHGGAGSNASAPAAAFPGLFHAVSPSPRTHTVLTDNGSEFACELARTVERARRTQWHTCPRAAKMNAHAQRFSRTVREEFVGYHEDTLFGNLETFSERRLEHPDRQAGHRPCHAPDLHTPCPTPCPPRDPPRPPFAVRNYLASNMGLIPYA